MEAPDASPTYTFAERFWSQVDTSNRNGCWVWTGLVMEGRGYGRFRYLRREGFAHRISWMVANGRQIPKGMWICHHCDNPPCVNPEHLFLGTPKDNTQDSVRKGRRRYNALRGERHPKAKLTAEQVKEIRRRHASGEPTRLIASDYGVVPGAVTNIISGIRWRSV